MGGGGASCSDGGSCPMNSVSVSCTASSCPSGSLCCGQINVMGGGMGGGGFSGSTECQQGSSCGMGWTQLCSSSVPCADSTDRCTTLGTIGVCEPPREGGVGHFEGGLPFEGGFPTPDGGFHPPDSGLGGD